MIGYGICLFYGIKISQDKVKGCAWLRASMNAPIIDLKYVEVPYYSVQSAELEMTPEEIAQSKVLAGEILERIEENKKRETKSLPH